LVLRRYSESSADYANCVEPWYGLLCQVKLGCCKIGGT
jgi:hypothetical protein